MSVLLIKDSCWLSSLQFWNDESVMRFHSYGYEALVCLQHITILLQPWKDGSGKPPRRFVGSHCGSRKQIRVCLLMDANLLWIFRAAEAEYKKIIRHRRTTVNTFGYIATLIVKLYQSTEFCIHGLFYRPHDVFATLRDNLKVQERRDWHCDSSCMLRRQGIRSKRWKTDNAKNRDIEAVVHSEAVAVAVAVTGEGWYCSARFDQTALIRTT